MALTKIEWTATQRPDGSWAPGFTFNPWWGCTKVSQGCKNCYAETLANRHQKDCWGPKGIRKMMSESYWQQPFKWDRQAEKSGVRAKVFCASMADVFEGRETMPAESWPMVCEARERLWELIEATTHLDWLLLTKRPENVVPIMCEHNEPDAGSYNWSRFPDNVWIGTSVEDQEQAEKRIPHLAQIPAKVRFLSCEPLLGSVSIGYAGLNAVDYGAVWWPDWVIVGGESGPGKRPFDPEWGRRILRDCKAAGVAFFGKQWDKVQKLPDDLMVREFPTLTQAEEGA